MLKNNTDKKGTFLPVIIGIMASFIVIFLIAIMVNLSRGYYWRNYTDEKALFINLSRQNYSVICSDIYYDRFRMSKKSDEYKNFEAIADYNEAALLYHAYERTGTNSKRQDLFLERLKDAKSRMGQYEYAADEIETYFE